MPQLPPRSPFCIMEAALEEATRQDVPAAAQLQAFSLLIKIVSNVLEPPTCNVEEAGKYRCLNSNSNALQQRVLRHGPAYENLLFALGFLRTVEPPPPRAAQLQQRAEQQQQLAEPQQQQAEPGQRQDEKKQQQQTEAKKQHAEEQLQQKSEQQQQQTEQQQEAGGQPYYYYLPEDVDLNALLESLQLLRATTESLKLAGAGSCSGEKQLTAGDDAATAAAAGRDTANGGAKPGFGTSASLHTTAVEGVKLPLTTSRAIREQAQSAHAKNQAALRQLREEQRERFEHRAETTRGSKTTAGATPVAPAGGKDTTYLRRGSRSRGEVDSAGSRFKKKGSPQAATDAADDFTDAAPAAPGAASEAAGVRRKKSQKSSTSLQAAGRFFRKLCKGKSFGSLGKQRGGAAAT